MRGFQSLIRGIVLTVVACVLTLALHARSRQQLFYQYPDFACGSIPARVVALDRDDQREAESIVRERLLPAGGYLANLLNKTLITP